ncbi:hypothetical protein KEM48_007990 [Puccinia striiformis f. sp. tritici PST-130]|nr:hypothetical protein KEM48_007990 [Puccinia striiformis f. sp. tritici PST-130]
MKTYLRPLKFSPEIVHFPLEVIFKAFGSAGQSSNFINHKSNSDFALPSELPLDHQTSRSNNEKRTSPQNPDTTLSKSNERSRSRLLERITSPFKGKSYRIIIRKKEELDLHYISSQPKTKNTIQLNRHHQT